MVVDVIRRFKQPRLTDWSFRSVGILSLLLLCFLCCYLFYLEYTIAPLRKGVSIVKGGILSNGSKEECDLFDGKWVWDDGYPLYESRDCGFLDGGFRCSDNGRPDNSYTKWRWQPNNCNLPRSGFCS